MQANTRQLAYYGNFNFIRLVAAATVIFSHSFLIAEKTDANEPLVRLLGEGNILGIFGVYAFFVTSGFLVTQSASASGVVSFLYRRALRIYPAFILYTVLSVFVLGTVYTTMDGSAYLLRPRLIKFVLYDVALPNEGAIIPTVQFYDPAVSSLALVVNGSLWTIRQELICYGLVAALQLLRCLRLMFMFPLMVFALTWQYFFATPMGGSEVFADFVYIAPYFFAGSLVWLIRQRWGLNPAIALACTVLSLVNIALVPSDSFGPIFLAYPLVYLSTSRFVRLPRLERLGDISYGTYLYGWPTEQVINRLLGTHATWWGVFCLSLPVAMLFGWLSWHLVEKRALRLKRLWPAKRAASASGAGDTGVPSR